MLHMYTVSHCAITLHYITSMCLLLYSPSEHYKYIVLSDLHLPMICQVELPHKCLIPGLVLLLRKSQLWCQCHQQEHVTNTVHVLLM